MATLQKIRSRGTILILILGLALFAFIAEELVRALSSSRNASRQVIGEVYGENVNYQEYNELVDAYENAVKLNNGNQNLTEAQSIQIRDQVWNEYVGEKIIEHEAKALGLKVTDAELQSVINTGSSQILRQTPFVNQQGNFDVNSLNQFLTSYNEIMENAEYPAEQKEMVASYYKYWQFVEKQVRNEILAQKYQSLLMGCLRPNTVSAKAAFEAHNNETDILLAAIPYTSIKDSEVEVSDKELKAKYEEQKKQYPTRYDMPEEARDIKYILVTVTASEADKAALTEEMKEYATALEQGENLANIVREAHSSIAYNGVPMSRKALPADIASIVDSVAPGSIVGPTTSPDNTMNVVKYIAKVQQPDSVQYRTISVPGTDAQAVQRADSILTALNGGAVIDSIAKRYNQAAQEMWLTSAQIDGATLRDDDRRFVETALNTPVGSYRKLEVSGGNIIMKVSDRRNIIDKYDVAIIKRPIDFSEDTHNKVWNDLSEFIAANPTQADIEANAPQKGYTVMTNEYMTAGSHYVANVHGTTDALRWIFKEDTKIGAVSELYEAGNANDQLLVVMLTGIHKKGWRSLEDEELKQFISEEVIKDKKADMILAKIKDAKNLMDIAKVQGAVQDTISQITFSSPAFVMKTASTEPALSGAATGAKMGQFVNGIKGNGGIYSFVVIKKKPLDAQFDAKQENIQLSSVYMRSLNLLMPTLARKAKITDNRYKFYQ